MQNARFSQIIGVHVSPPGMPHSSSGNTGSKGGLPFIAAAALRLVQSGSPLFATGNLLDKIDNPPSQFRILDPHECFGEG